MSLEEKNLSSDEIEELKNRGKEDSQEFRNGKALLLEGKVINPDNRDFFQHVINTIPLTRAAVDKVEPEMRRVQGLADSTKQKLEELKRKQQENKESQQKAQQQAAEKQKSAGAQMNKKAESQKSENSAKQDGAENSEQQAPKAEKKQEGQEASNKPEQAPDLSDDISLLEQDLNFYNGALLELPAIKDDAQKDLNNLEGILSSGEKKSWSAITDFWLKPTPGERAQSNNKDKDNNKGEKGQDKDDASQDAKNKGGKKDKDNKKDEKEKGKDKDKLKALSGRGDPAAPQTKEGNSQVKEKESEGQEKAPDVNQQGIGEKKEEIKAAPEKKKTSKHKFNDMRGIGVSPASPKKKIDGKDLQLDPNFIAEYREKMGKSNSGK